MAELDEELCPFAVDGVSDLRQHWHYFGAVGSDLMITELAARVRRAGLDREQSGATGGARLLVGDQIVGWEAVRYEARLVRGRDDPVADLDRPDLQRCEKMLEAHRPGTGSNSGAGSPSAAAAAPRPVRTAPSM